MKEFIYPAALVLIPLVYNTSIQSPKLAIIQETLKAQASTLKTNTETLNAHTETLKEVAGKFNVLVNTNEAIEVRQETIEKAHLAFEQCMAQRRNLAVKMKEAL